MSIGGTNVGGIYYDVTLETRGLVNGQREVSRRLDTIGREGERLKTRFTAVAAAISAAISAIALDGFITKLIQTQRRFDVMNASLKTVTGSTAAAADAFERLRTFAAQTPYTLDQSVQGFVKLKALGLDPSERSMRSFGNTSAAMGKDLMQMIEAVADAATGEFERLKEFGIRARQQGDQVSFTFQGVTTTVRNRAKEITEYLTQIGEVQFAGAMAERMRTLDGDISNLQDSIEQLFLTISQSGFGDAMAAGVRKASEAISELSDSVREGELTEYFEKVEPAIRAVEIAGVSLAGLFAGRLLLSLKTATAATLAKIAANREAAAATVLALKLEESKALVEARSAAAAQAAAAAEVQKAAATVASTRATVANLTVQAQAAAMNAKLAAGTAAHFQAAAIERTVVAQLAAAKTAEAEATAALYLAETRLTASRGAAVAATSAATASTVALTAAQRAQTVVATAAAAATRAAAGVLAALGGPIGIAITGLMLLAWHWDKVGGEARDAAEISEQAAQRIAKALKKSPDRADKDLAAQLKDVQEELTLIDKELARTGANMASAEDLAELRERRDTLVKVAADIRAARNSLGAGPGRGNINPPFVTPDDGDDDAVDQEALAKAASRRAAAQSYYEGLLADTRNGLAKIDAEEQQALQDNARRAAADVDNAGIYARAKTLIVEKYARERALLQEQYAREAAAAEIAIVTDEQERILKIREEAFRAADADVRLGVKTVEQAEQAKRVAAFQFGLAMVDAADRAAQAEFEMHLAMTENAEERIALIERETVRAAELAFAMGRITEAELAAARARASQQSAGSLRDLDRQRDDVRMDTLQTRASAGGVEDQVAVVRAEAERRIQASLEAQQRDLANAQLYADQRVAIEEEMYRRIAEMRESANQAAYSSMASGLGQLTEALRSETGKQDALYKAAFVAQKAYAIASSIVAIQSGVAKAADAPWPLNIAAMAQVAAATASIIATIKSANYGGGRQFGGPVSAGTIYRVNESGRPEMFTAANGAQYMLPTRDGRVTSADRVAGEAGGGRGQARPIQVVQHFTINGGPADLRTQQQIAAAAARGLQTAAARNN